MENYKPYCPELREEVTELVRQFKEQIIPRLHYLQSLPALSPEEQEEMRQIYLWMDEVMPIVTNFMNGLNAHLLQYSKNMFLNAGLAGKKGDEDSQRFYLELKDSYKAMTDEELRNNMN